MLCLAEGYGRNALWLAAQGHPVTAIEQSSVGIARAKDLGVERGVEVTWVQGDLADVDLGEGKWSGIVSVFAHLPPALRADVHARAVRALALAASSSSRRIPPPSSGTAPAGRATWSS